VFLWIIVIAGAVAASLNPISAQLPNTTGRLSPPRRIMELIAGIRSGPS
jgi:hypothetical protein